METVSLCISFTNRIAMEVSTILTADVLDIIFEGRNKSYGAYELRKSYQRRLTIAITVMLSVVLLLLTGYVIASNQKDSLAKEMIIPPDMTLANIEPERPEELPPPPPPKQPEPPVMKTIQFTTPKITHEELKPEEKLPENTDLEDVKVGTKTQDGLKDNGFAPPVDDGDKGVIVAPKKEEPDWSSTFMKVEIESSYPGGQPAWSRFLNKNLSNNYPQVAIDNEIEGTVMIQFIVDSLGNVSHVEAIDGPEELRDVAIRMVRKSGQWIPAIQSGRKVKSYKRQPIVFKLFTE